VVELQDRHVKKTYRARLLEGAERADWWQHAVDTWPTYASYQKKTERLIPVFLLEPVA
jgi:deazaflavin-dependent oxidoreductase (nitroreductase family)